MFRLTLGCTLLLAVPAAAQSTASAPAAPATQQPIPPAKEKKVCKVDTSTGSIMPKRSCKTVSEWNAIAGAARAVPDDLRQWQQTQRTVSGNR
ncbi:hypothetical protein ACUXST_001383 [Sphingomonas sp. F9_3S_D5_B_2]